jgi:hypothetical protein
MATTSADRRLDEVHASEHVVAAARAIYNRAIAAGLIEQKDSPAHRVVKPRRLPNTRRALTPENSHPSTTSAVSHPVERDTFSHFSDTLDHTTQTPANLGFMEITGKSGNLLGVGVSPSDTSISDITPVW